ncbi:MAG: O-antigen ligase family protein [Gammaproteobacteria bacterium]|nr:O-antigen ligase family protein [Gammaproteobacteria bacterium]
MSQTIKSRLNLAIRHYILPLGLFFFLTGIIYFKSFSSYHTQIYLFLIVPTFILLLNERELFHLLLRSRAFQIILLLFCYAIMSLLWNDSAINDFKYFKRLLIILLFILALVAIGRDNPEKIIIILLVAATVYVGVACYSIFQDYIVQNKRISTRIIGVGNLSNPLLSSHIYGIFTSFLLVYFFSINRYLKRDIALMLMFVTLLFFVILTGSRTPLVGLGVVLLVLLWMNRSKYMLYFFLAICVLAITYFSYNYEFIIQRGLSYRPEIWSITMDQIMLKPLLGHGLGTSIHIESDKLTRIFSDTHNIHLGLTYKLGILGLLIWFALLISLLNIYFRNRTSQIAQIGIVLLVYGVSAGMTEGTSFLSRPKEVWFLIWLPIALLFVAEYNQMLSNRLGK